MELEIDPSARAAQARAYFKEGYNCAQSVIMAYADLYDLDIDLAAKISSSFGGGMGRLREVCGTCSGMFMVASMAVPANDISNKAAKAANYKLVQELAEEFKSKNGSIICRELLGLDHKIDPPTPSERTGEYYKKRPCTELVYMAAEIVGRKLLSMQQNKE